MMRAILSLILAAILQSPTITVKGHIVDGQNNQPLSGVQVFFGAPGNIRGAATNSEGRFSIVVPEGTYDVSLKKDGYVYPRADTPIGRDANESLVTIDINDKTPELQFRLIQGGVITGRVFESDGRPAALRRVSLMQRFYDENGEPSTSIAGTATVDDRGEYRLFGVEAGDYYIAVDSQTTVPPNVRAISSQRGAPNILTFYPGTTDWSEALLVHLKRGADVRLGDITTRIQQSVPIQLRVQNLTGFMPSGLTVEIQKNQQSLVSRNFGTADLSANFDLNPLPPGTYECTVTLSGTAYSASNTITFHVEGGAVQLDVSVANGWVVHGQVDVRQGDSFKPVSGVSMSLWTPGQASSKYEASGENGALEIRGVSGGMQRIRLLSLPPNTYVAAVQQHDADIPASGIDITGDTSIHVILGTNGGSISGRIVDSNMDRVQFGLAVLVPDDSNRFMNYYVSDSNENGQFGFRNIAPGNYHLYAWEELHGAAYLNSDFMADYKDKGRAVRVEPGGQLNLNDVQVQ